MLIKGDTMAAQSVEEALIALLRKHGSVEADQLSNELLKMEFTRAQVRAALSRALNNGSVHLGRDLRIELEPA